MNSLIKSIFSNFIVDGVKIPVSFLRYNGTAKTYVTYQEITKNNPFSTDDKLNLYASYYDFDIFSKSDYFNVAERMKQLLEENGFTWSVEFSGPDMYEDDTKYFHKTLTFYYIRNEKPNEIPSV